MYEFTRLYKLIKPQLYLEIRLQEVGVMSLFAPNGKSLLRSPNPPFFGVSSPFDEPGVPVRLSGGDPRVAKNNPESFSLSAGAVTFGA